MYTRIFTTYTHIFTKLTHTYTQVTYLDLPCQVCAGGHDGGAVCHMLLCTYVLYIIYTCIKIFTIEYTHIYYVNMDVNGQGTFMAHARYAQVGMPGVPCYVL